MTILAVSDESLLQYGWAPGGYMIRCMGCGGDGLDGIDGCAKRSIRCRACAVKCWERDIAKPPSPMTGDGTVVRPSVDEAFTGYLAKLKITAATGFGSWKKGANDALGNVVTAWDAVARPHILAQAAKIERLTRERDQYRAQLELHGHLQVLND